MPDYREAGLAAKDILFGVFGAVVGVTGGAAGAAAVDKVDKGLDKVIAMATSTKPSQADKMDRLDSLPKTKPSEVKELTADQKTTARTLLQLGWTPESVAAVLNGPAAGEAHLQLQEAPRLADGTIIQTVTGKVIPTVDGERKPTVDGSRVIEGSALPTVTGILVGETVS